MAWKLEETDVQAAVRQVFEQAGFSQRYRAALIAALCRQGLLPEQAGSLCRPEKGREKNA